MDNNFCEFRMICSAVNRIRIKYCWIEAPDLSGSSTESMKVTYSQVILDKNIALTSLQIKFVLFLY